MAEKQAEKQMEEIDIEGAEKIGEGAHSEVYRIADDTIVKVYHPLESLERIRKEKELSRWAFVKGVPTAISFNVVRIGERYGLIYEMINACFAPEYIKKSEEHFEDFVKRSVDLMQQIHAIEVAPGELPDMKEQTRGWIGKCRQYMDAGICDRLGEFLEEIPDSHTLLHADYHIKNIMVSDSELMLIDMDTLCMGDPIFELATIYNSYKEFPSVSPEAAAFLGIDVETANRLWERTVELYVGDSRYETVPDVERRAQILGCVRIIDYMDRHSDFEDSERCIEICKRDIKTAL